MTRTPILALALAALAGPALAQENQPAPEGQETRPTNQTTQQTTEGFTEQQAEVDANQPENAMGTDGQGGTGGLVAGDGTELGNVTVQATASGHALVVINAEGFREGVYAVHLHQVGACDGPDFESAGEHIGGTDEHGVMTDTGPHHGDLPNAHVGPDQQLAMESFAISLGLDEVFDEDGSALVVHANPDDYTTQPGGNSGDRVACAIIEVAPGTVNDDTQDASEVSGEPAGGDLQEDVESGNEDAQPEDPAAQEQQDGEAAEGESSGG